MPQTSEVDDLAQRTIFQYCHRVLKSVGELRKCLEYGTIRTLSKVSVGPRMMQLERWLRTPNREWSGQRRRMAV